MLAARGHRVVPSFGGGNRDRGTARDLVGAPPSQQESRQVGTDPTTGTSEGLRLCYASRLDASKLWEKVDQTLFSFLVYLNVCLQRELKLKINKLIDVRQQTWGEEETRAWRDVGMPSSGLND